MRKTLILIQENQFSDAQVALLEKLIRNHYRNHVSRERRDVLRVNPQSRGSGRAR